jgi:hypothetical protein
METIDEKLEEKIAQLGGLSPCVASDTRPLTSSELSDVEQQWGICLPKNYRAWILTDRCIKKFK